MNSLLLRCRSHLIQMPTIFDDRIAIVEAKKTTLRKLQCYCLRPRIKLCVKVAANKLTHISTKIVPKLITIIENIFISELTFCLMACLIKRPFGSIYNSGFKPDVLIASFLPLYTAFFSQSLCLPSHLPVTAPLLVENLYQILAKMCQSDTEFSKPFGVFMHLV